MCAQVKREPPLAYAIFEDVIREKKDLCKVTGMVFAILKKMQIILPIFLTFKWSKASNVIQSDSPE